MSEHAKKCKYRMVAVNENGCRVGETHHRAKLTDHDVDLIRELHEEHGLSYSQLAEKFGCSKSTIRDYCQYRRRCQFPEKWRRVRVDD